MRIGVLLGVGGGLAGLCAGALAAAAPAGDGTGQALTARRAGFRMSAVTFGALRAMGESGDISRAAFPASGLALWAKALPGSFPAGSDGAGSDALPLIWSDQAGFAAAAAAYQTATARLESAAKAGDVAGFRAALAETGKACGSCHDRYRKPQPK
ncbi:cytochrome c [Sphingomonas changnyeongensis]|uniref:Cytochrome c n=1 Tax=Sphingomonas changnyeongensis TaxID=2698679 RepID=A0A7Z2S4E1_9SPHN|nr:cytochrome c [Sphingomonas changnyeongensis]QHL89970.1 cytochrome c [Sphingomonas changnyeongensis]